MQSDMLAVVEVSPCVAVTLKEATKGEALGSVSASSSQGQWQNGLGDMSDDGRSYFARDLEELSALPADGKAGPRAIVAFRTGSTYLGQWLGNLRHGLGEQTWSDGAKFVGQWNRSFAEGHGHFVHADGDIFIGMWQRNMAQGLGSYYSAQGVTTYRGQWAEDCQHGCGVEATAGGRYHGQFVYGKKEGHGIYIWPDGSVYVGEWRNNIISGTGYYKGKDENEFRGQWRDAVIHGFGMYTWADGRTFRGQYADDRKEGFGVFTWKDGRRLEGFWREGKQHGFCATYAASGELLKAGCWNMGLPPEEDRDLCANAKAKAAEAEGERID